MHGVELGREMIVKNDKLLQQGVSDISTSDIWETGEDKGRLRHF